MMRQIAIISGKGGTGKTSLTASFAQLATKCIVADCDVDAANLHLILSGSRDLRAPIAFRSGYYAEINSQTCNQCGECASLCRFDAICTGTLGQTEIEPLICEGCGLCVDICPSGAISLNEKIVGSLLETETPYGPLIHGKLGIAQSASGKLVTAVRRRAEEVAHTTDCSLILIDGSPGIGCPVIASLSGVDAAVIVTEPTVSGRHDMLRVLELCKNFGIETFLVINKWDLNPEQSNILTDLGRTSGMELLGLLRFDPLFSKALAQGKTLLDYAPDSASAEEIRLIWNNLTQQQTPSLSDQYKEA